MVNVWRARNLIGLSCLLVLTTAASCVQVKGAEPAVSSIAVISFPAKGATYEVGEEVEVAVHFDRAVTATGSPQVALTIGSETRHATFVGWGRKSLYFYYIVQSADRDENGISIAPNALVLNGGTITAANGTTDADLTHGAVAAKRRSKVDGSLVTPPRVKNVSLLSHPATGDTYKLGEEVEVTVDFDRAVTTTGSPQVALTIGSETRRKRGTRPLSAGAESPCTSTTSCRRRTAMRARDLRRLGQDGISIAANALLLDGGTIKSADGSADADLDHSVTGPDPTRKVSGSRSTP
jgi:hypothetical protein